MLSLASASLSFQASAPLTAPSTVARRANVVASDQDQIGFQNSRRASTRSPGASYDQVRTWREAELAHGRVGMLAAAGFIVQGKFHPLFTGDGGPAIDQFAKLPVIMWPLITIFIGGCESLRISKGWSNPNEPDHVFQKLLPEYVPGDIGFDPLGLKPTDPEEFRIMQTKIR